MKFSTLDKWFSAARDWHIAVYVIMFGIGSVLQYLHHLDMAFVAFTGTLVGGLTGHAYSPAGKDTPAAVNPPPPVIGIHP